MFYVWKMCQHLIAPKITQKCRQMYHTWSIWDVECWRSSRFPGQKCQSLPSRTLACGTNHSLHQPNHCSQRISVDHSHDGTGLRLYFVAECQRFAYPLVIKHVNMGNPPFVYLSMIFPLKPPAGDFPGLNIEGYISFIFLCGVDFLLMLHCNFR